MHHSVIVLPTYNERENIGTIVSLIFSVAEQMQEEAKISVLVVDDSSPDGTGELVKLMQESYPDLYMITGKKEGLGKAYIRGMQYAIREMDADSVFEMDADLSHDPAMLPVMLRPILNGAADFVIGSRYIPGGSIPSDWPLARKLNSWAGSFFSRFVIGLYSVKDAMGGFRAIRSEVAQATDLETIPAAGYAFQVTFLQRAVLAGARVLEVPIAFRDRAFGTTKMRFKDQFEFVIKSIILRLYAMRIRYGVLALIVLTVAAAGSIVYLSDNTLAGIVVSISLLLTMQGVWNLGLLIRAWDDPYTPHDHGSPKVFTTPRYSFTALLPALHEEAVIGDTIRALAAMEYPSALRQIIVICRFDDTGTITAAQKAIDALTDVRAELVIYNSLISNKPKQMNFGLLNAVGDVIVPFDAEDQPHPDLYNIVNTVMVEERVDVVQSGVQLMNFESNWYSIYNVLEYFFWFKSVLPYFASRGAVPLGGNTVFFKRKWLARVGGWDEECLTEDAEIGMKLSQAGARIKVIYEEQHVTQEETPPTLSVFIKQRTRWHQGFMQVLAKGQWRKFLTLRQQLLSLYVLLWPVIQAFTLIYAVAAAVAFLFIKLPMWATIIAIVPFYLLIVLFVVAVVGLYQFCKSYNKPFPWWIALKMLIAFYPFKLILDFSAMRALYRITKGLTSWEKTVHIGAHRAELNPQEVSVK